ncbi:pilin [Granulosicoccus antarcticus]|uniref:Fimbrial protein n=1 Tax=Granulosicoccus antarcticus IMCC3135 TaxID=1192854 RepID=A0A2Z2P0M9_9GAMM|nr:prepilin-type N-terminal cleavage/methylation domain-containing protein [Granulosicoccus antarcticus]ASJ75871.1 Fimbrial protein [Granulosicoccus antarcticus IMCC3135]
MLERYTTHKGFTLIELMIVIAIIGILAAAAVPQYAAYTKKAKFSEVVVLTAEYKSSVHLCVQDRNELDPCDSGQNGVPPAVSTPRGYLKSLTVVNGTITSTATDLLDEMQYILTASYTPSTNIVRWAVSGSCLSANLCSK